MANEKYVSMTKVIKFFNNYPPNWIQQAFAGDEFTAKHLQSKWNGYAKDKSKSSYDTILRMINELDNENLFTLMEYIDSLYEEGGELRTKTIKVFSFNELSDEAKEKAIEDYRQNLYKGNDFAEWAVDDDYLFEPKQEEMTALFGEKYKVIPTSKYGDEPMIGNTRENLYYDTDRNSHLDADDAIEINNREMFLTWLGIPKELQDKLDYHIKDDGGRNADTIIEFEPNDYDYEFTEEENKILSNAENKFSNHMSDVLKRISEAIDYHYSDEGITEDILANDSEYMEDGSKALFLSGGIIKMLNKKISVRDIFTK